MKRNYPIFRLFLGLGLTLIFLLIVSVVFYFKSRPTIYTVAVSNAETMSLKYANTAATEVLEENSVDYEKIVNLSSNADGEIMSLNINQYEINKLKSDISQKVSDLVCENEDCPVSIPFGSLLGNEYTAGLGPMIKIPMRITSTAYIDFKNEFVSAGINNVLHKILVIVNIKGTVVMTGTKYSFSVTTDFIAAQTVISGRVPDAFTNVIENPGDDMAGYIFDYGYTE